MDKDSNAKLIDFLCQIGELKQIPRQGWVNMNVPNPETISGHMYRMSIIPLLCLKNDASLDFTRVIKLSLAHDMAECIVGDITPADNVPKEEKQRLELDAIKALGELLPSEGQKELTDLFHEYEFQTSPEAKLTKDLDRFDLILQAFQYEKREFARLGKLIDIQCFLRLEKDVQNGQIQALVSEIMKQRKEFLDSIKE